MHDRALAPPTKKFGKFHVETAQNYGDLALILVRTKNVKESLEHFKEFENDPLEYDYEIVLANYRDVLESLGDGRAIIVLNKSLWKNGFSLPG
ncbi:MAG: tetratricopeptide repeat protein [Akkermansiaceae bacterium]